MNRLNADERDRERGTTLVELLVTIVILGLAIVALLGGLTTAVVVSDQHRQQGVTDAAVHSYAEAVAAQGYVDCASLATYQAPAGYTTPPGYTSRVTRIRFWNASTRAFDLTACPSTGDTGAQLVRVSVRSPQGRGVHTLDVVLREAGA